MHTIMPGRRDALIAYGKVGQQTVETLWLGYNGLTVPYRSVVAVLFYRSVLDPRIERAYGMVPGGVRSVVVTSDGDYFPARWRVSHVRQRWAHWRMRQDGTPPVLQ
jgi:hypothetical protein